MIIKSAFFEVLPNKIGRIVYPDGSTSMMFATKRQAIEIVEAQEGINLLEEELKIIKQQIHECPLLDKDTKIEEDNRNIQNSIDEIKRKAEFLFKS